MNLDEFINDGLFIKAISPLKDEIVDNKSIPLVGYYISHAIKYYLLFQDSNYTNEDLYNYINNLALEYSTFDYKDYDYMNFIIDGRNNIRKHNNSIILEEVLRLFNLEKDDLKDLNNKKKVYDFINKKCVDDSYMFHAFNSSVEDSIIKYGISSSKRLHSEDEVLEIDKLFKKYGDYGILNDFESSSMGSFYYSKDPIVSYWYGLKAPEWFYMFTGGSRSYTNDNRYDSYAYIDRNYDSSLNNLSIMMDKLSFTEEDRNKVIDFFNNNWNNYTKCEPRLLILKDNYNEDRDNTLEDEDYSLDPIKFIDESFNIYNNDYDTDVNYPEDISIENGMIIELPTQKDIINKLHPKVLIKTT